MQVLLTKCLLMWSFMFCVQPREGPNSCNAPPPVSPVVPILTVRLQISCNTYLSKLSCPAGCVAITASPLRATCPTIPTVGFTVPAKKKQKINN